jgi:chaperonin cofactor prefoldin
VDDTRREIADVLAATDITDQQAALRVLGRAFQWAADSIGRVDGGASGSNALAALYALDDALEDSQVLAEALPGLLAAARPGDRVGSGTDELMRRLTEVSDQVAADRATLEKLAATEEALHRRLAEHEELRKQVDELRRLERLVVALDALREQQEVISERLAELRGRDAGVDEALRTSSDALVRLTEDQLSILAPQTGQTLERAAAAQSALAAAEREHQASTAELASYHDRLERIQAERGALLASLSRHAQADRELARALRDAAAMGGDTSAVQEQRVTLAQVEAAAEAIERRLREADETLGGVLQERAAQDTEGRVMVLRTGA